MEYDDPEERIRELERGISDQSPRPTPQDQPPPNYQQWAPQDQPPQGWAGYTPTNQPWPAAPMVVKRNAFRGWVWLAVGLGAIGPVIAAIVIFFGSATPFTPAPQLHTADGLTGLIDSVRGEFGDTTGYELVVYPDYAIIDRASPTNEHAQQNFIYRGDWEQWAPDTMVSPFDHLVDLSQFDAAGVSTTLAEAAQLLDIDDATTTYLIIASSGGSGIDIFRKDGPAPNVKLTIHVTAPASGWIDINPDGSVVTLHPPGG